MCESAVPHTHPAHSVFIFLRNKAVYLAVFAAVADLHAGKAFRVFVFNDFILKKKKSHSVVSSSVQKDGAADVTLGLQNNHNKSF